jgi:hypothetical protein
VKKHGETDYIIQKTNNKTRNYRIRRKLFRKNEANASSSAEALGFI